MKYRADHISQLNNDILKSLWSGWPIFRAVTIGQPATARCNDYFDKRFVHHGNSLRVSLPIFAAAAPVQLLQSKRSASPTHSSSNSADTRNLRWLQYGGMLLV
jgi:hypothetical protein